MRKQGCQLFGYHVGKLVFRDSVSDIEKEMIAWPESPKRLFETLKLVRKEHHAKLTGHNVKALIRKRQSQRIGLSPFNPILLREPCTCMIKH